MTRWFRFLFLGCLLLAWSPFTLQGGKQVSEKRVPVHFTFHPQKPAHSVSVVGDFNDWKPDATPMVCPDSSGMWHADLELPYGVYEYRFLVDGKKWVRDPNNLLYGGKNSNSLLIVNNPDAPSAQIVSPLPGQKIRRFPIKIQAVFQPGASGTACSEIKSILQIDRNTFVPVLVQDSLITAFVDSLPEGFHQWTLFAFDRVGRAARPVWGAFIVNRFNQPPVANSGPLIFGFARKPLALNAGCSYDPDLDPIRSIDWQFDGRDRTPQVKTGAFPVIRFDSTGTYPVQLSAADSLTRSKLDSNTIRVFETQDYPTKFLVSAAELGVPKDSLKNIALVGEFNNWDPKGFALTDSDSDGVWQASVMLPPGEYEYKFVINGEKWVPDPMNPRKIPDGWQGFNSLRTVQRPPIPVIQWQVKVAGDSIYLDASGSYDPMGDSLSIQWLPDRLNPAPLTIPQKWVTRFPVPPRDGVYWVHVIVTTPRRTPRPQTVLIKKLGTQTTVMNLEDSPAWAKNVVIYELYVRNFTKEGTLKGVRKNLSYLTSLGVNTIWLMPIFESPSDHGYNPSNFRKIRPEYGTLKDFRDLVEAVHKKHMKIVLDFVANHTSDQHPYFKCAYRNPKSVFRGWYIWHGPHVYDYYNDWDAFPNLNYKNPNVWHFMLENASFWAKQGVDGFRCDVAWGVPHSFWKAFRRVLKGINPEFLLLDEVLPRSPAYHDQEFDMSYDTDFYGNLLDVFRGRKPLSSLDEGYKKSLMNYPPQALSLHYLENHDMKRFLVQFGAAKTELASVLLFTFPGTPMLYSGEEQGEAVAFPRILKKDAFSPWFQFYQQLIGLRQKNLAFREGTYQRIQNDVQEKIFSFLRFQGDQEFLIALNFSKKPVATTLLLEKSRYPDLDNTNATWKQVLPNTEEKWPFTATPKLKLDGFGYKVLELVRK